MRPVSGGKGPCVSLKQDATKKVAPVVRVGKGEVKQKVPIVHF